MKISQEKPVRLPRHSGGQAESFSDWLSESGLLESTQAKHGFAVQSFFRQFRNMTQRNLNIFFKDEKKRWTIDGIRRYIQYCKYDFELPKIERPPVKDRERPSFEKLERILNSIDFENKDTEWALKTSFVTGASRQKILSRKYKDIDHEKETLKIPGQGEISIKPIYKKLDKFLKKKGLHNSERLFYTDSVSVAAAAYALSYYTKRLKTSEENRKILSQQADAVVETCPL